MTSIRWRWLWGKAASGFQRNPYTQLILRLPPASRRLLLILHLYILRLPPINPLSAPALITLPFLLLISYLRLIRARPY